MKILNIVLVAVFSLGLVGCSVIQKPFDQPQHSVENSTAPRIEQAILAAKDSSGGWKLKKLRNGAINGIVLDENYYAEVEIAYDSTGYSIKYVNSYSHVKVDDKTLITNYNRWVAKLDNDIQQNLRRG